MFCQRGIRLHLIGSTARFLTFEPREHAASSVANEERTCAFYERTLQFKVVEKEGRRALQFRQQKINIHPLGKETDPKAARPTPGSGDVCFIASTSLEKVQRQVVNAGVPIELGPVERNDALCRMISFCFRDPDRNPIDVL